jgi:hypothetical protein
MKTRNLRATVALGSLTATVALLAGLSSASAQAPMTAPGGGSFPQSFLVPGTNTSLSIYGQLKSVWQYNIGQHDGDTQTTANTAPFHTSQLALSGPGVGGGNTNTNTEAGSLNGGLRGFGKASNFTFETRTPSDLGEIKTVMSFDANLFSNQSTYVSPPIAATGTAATSTKPSAGSGNTDAIRLLWAYGTIGPWLIGQYNTAWADPLLFPDIGDAGFDPGLMNTANIRQSQIRYTYLAGNGLTISGSVEQDEGGVTFIQHGTGPMASAAMTSYVTDNTDVGGINNLPDFNAGLSWDQPWGHLMARVGIAENEVNNSEVQNIFVAPNLLPVPGGFNTPGNRISKFGEAFEAGGYLNTWGHDQWKFLFNYSNGIANFNTDLSATSAGNEFCNGYTGQCGLISDTTLYTMYVHRFNPNWRWTADAGIGFFSKPSGASSLTNVAAGTANAQLASLEKRHITAHTDLIWSPVPGLTDIYLEFDHWNRQVQASGTSGQGSKVDVAFIFYW